MLVDIVVRRSSGNSALDQASVAVSVNGGPFTIVESNFNALFIPVELVPGFSLSAHEALIEWLISLLFAIDLGVRLRLPDAPPLGPGEYNPYAYFRPEGHAVWRRWRQVLDALREVGSGANEGGL